MLRRPELAMTIASSASFQGSKSYASEVFTSFFVLQNMIMKRVRADFGIVCRVQPIRYRLSHLFKKTLLRKRDFQYTHRDEYYR